MNGVWYLGGETKARFGLYSLCASVFFALNLHYFLNFRGVHCCHKYGEVYQQWNNEDGIIVALTPSFMNFVWYGYVVIIFKEFYKYMLK